MFQRVTSEFELARATHRPVGEYAAEAQSLARTGQAFLQVGPYRVRPRYPPGWPLLLAAAIRSGVAGRDLWRITALFGAALAWLLGRPTISSVPMTRIRPPITGIGICSAAPPATMTRIASEIPAKTPAHRVRAPRQPAAATTDARSTIGVHALPP